MSSNISSVVAFQRWCVLKSKLFAQESTCSKEILMFSLVSRKFLAMRNIALYSVLISHLAGKIIRYANTYIRGFTKFGIKVL